MLQMRPNCESCNANLAADAPNALICSFECTFCADCAANRFQFVCPNCGGQLVERPSRPTSLLLQYPAATERVIKNHEN